MTNVPSLSPQEEAVEDDNALITGLLRHIENVRQQNSQLSPQDFKKSHQTCRAIRTPLASEGSPPMFAPTALSDAFIAYSPNESNSVEHGIDACLSSSFQNLDINHQPQITNNEQLNMLAAIQKQLYLQQHQQHMFLQQHTMGAVPPAINLLAAQLTAQHRQEETWLQQQQQQQQLAFANQRISPSVLQQQQVPYNHLSCINEMSGLPYNTFSQQQQLIPEECLVGLNGVYQNYVNQIISDELNVNTLSLLCKVRELQLDDPPFAPFGKRFFCSLKEVSKVVYKARAIIVAPDVRPSAQAHVKPIRLLKGVLNAAYAAGVPVIFALSRRGIGRVFGRDKSMSIVALMNIENVEAEYEAMVKLAAEGRELYRAHRR